MKNIKCKIRNVKVRSPDLSWQQTFATYIQYLHFKLLLPEMYTEKVIPKTWQHIDKGIRNLK